LIKEKEVDNVNWFGVKVVGSKQQLTTHGVNTSGEGVGKYLNLKRPVDAVATPEEASKKQRKFGFGEFDQW
jgi:hypothetical protein